MPEDEHTLVDQVPRTLRSEVQVAREGDRARRTPTLTQVSGPQRGAFVCVDAANRALFLGRDETCDFVVDDSSVSRRHARVYVDGSPGRPSRVVLQDLGSTNGTLVNGTEIERVDLKHGDLEGPAALAEERPRTLKDYLNQLFLILRSISDFI